MHYDTNIETLKISGTLAGMDLGNLIIQLTFVYVWLRSENGRESQLTLQFLCLSMGKSGPILLINKPD